MESANDIADMKLIDGKASSTSPPVSSSISSVTGLTTSTCGWLPVLSLTSAFGVLLIALAFTAGRFAYQFADTLFWFGLVDLFVPVACRLLLQKPTRRERITLLIILGLALYLVKYLQYPLYFTYFDELVHSRTALDITTSGHLFQANPMSDIYPLYPGLEIVTNALSAVTGLPFFLAGIILLAVVRFLYILSLYLFYEHISNSAQAAGIATLLYIVNPGFLFQASEFGYESLALPLGIFVLYVVAHRCRRPAGLQRGLTIAISLGIGAVVITHHVTSFALVAFLLFWAAIWAVTTLLKVRDQKDQKSPFGMALLGLVMIAGWLVFTGFLAVGYLTQYLDSGVLQLIQILNNHAAPRQLFHSGSGSPLPLWEPVISYTSVALIMMGLPFGLWQVWKHQRSSAVILALAGASVAYPFSLLLRFTQFGAELSERTSEFLFVGVALVLALGATKFWLSRTPGKKRLVVIMGVVGIIFLGQTVVGNALPWDRMPGPYLIVADQRSIEPEGIAAAQWTGTYLSHNQRIATDRINMQLMTAYGDEWVVQGTNATFPIAQVFTLPQMVPEVVTILQQDHIQYIVVDRRLSTGLPQVGTYYDVGVPGQVLYTQPIEPAALAKFDGVQNVSRVFDSGNIVIYNVTGIALATTTVQPVPCVPTPPPSGQSPYMHMDTNYSGIIYDIATQVKTAFSLTYIQQRQGSICGFISGLNGKGIFKGSVTNVGVIHFVIAISRGETSLIFDGLVQADGTIAGSYCYPVGEKCADYGIWSLSPEK